MLLIIIDQFFSLLDPILPNLLQILVHIASSLELIEEQVNFLFLFEDDADKFLEAAGEGEEAFELFGHFSEIMTFIMLETAFQLFFHHGSISPNLF